MRRRLRKPAVACLAIACLSAWCLAVAPCEGKASEPGGSEAVVPLSSLEAFTNARGDSYVLPDEFSGNEKGWRQIAPSVYWLLQAHVAAVDVLPAERRRRLPGEAARFILEVRKRHADRVVIGTGMPIVGLLDPARGLDPRQVTALAEAYGGTATVFKAADDTRIDEVAAEFLQSVERLVVGGEPATVVVLGHGLPREIQSYRIPVEQLAKRLVGARGTTVDCSQMTLVFDDCYSADFCVALAGEMIRLAADESRKTTPLPTMIAGSNRCQRGHADAGVMFVPHFWEEVIELLYVRRPRPSTVTLGDFFGRIDNAMYGYGRRPVFEVGRIIGYRVIDPEIVQDPVTFVPLDEGEIDSVRRLFGVDDSSPLLPLLDIG